MGPAQTPSGSFHSIVVGRPESPGFFQYVCQPLSMASRSATVSGSPGLIAGLAPTTSASTWPGRTRAAATSAASAKADAAPIARNADFTTIGRSVLIVAMTLGSASPGWFPPHEAIILLVLRGATGGSVPAPPAAPPQPTGGTRTAFPPSVNTRHSSSIPMQAFFVSAGWVALGEIGDKTQLLALVLAARFGKPLPIIAGITTAPLVNHARAGLLGHLVRATLPQEVLRWVVAISFFAVAAWALKPDSLAAEAPTPMSRWSVFGVTTIAFFLAATRAQ